MFLMQQQQRKEKRRICTNKTQINVTEIGGGHIFDDFQYYVKSDLDFGKVTRDDSPVTLMSMSR